MTMGLYITNRQKIFAFVCEYLIDFNIFRAAIAARYSIKLYTYRTKKPSKSLFPALYGKEKKTADDLVKQLEDKQLAYQCKSTS